MPLLTITNIAANGVLDFMLDADQGAQNLRFVGGAGAEITYAADATAVGVELEILSGSRSIQERSAVDASGVAGVPPNLDQKAVSFLALPGEILQFRLREVGGLATTDLNLFIAVAT